MTPIIAETQMNGSERVLLRASGTEPLIRVMIEAENEKDTLIHAQAISSAVERAAE